MNDTKRLQWHRAGAGQYRLDCGGDPTGVTIEKIPEWSGYGKSGWRVLADGKSLTVLITLGQAKKWGIGFVGNPASVELRKRLAQVEDYERTVAPLRRGEMG